MGGTKFTPASIKHEKAPAQNDDPVYVKVKTQSDMNDLAQENSPGKIMQTDAHSNNGEVTEELPTIKTEIQPERVVPTFEDVKVKSTLDEKVGNKINKAGNQVNGLVDLAESKEEFQTDVRKQNGDTDSQSDFDDLEFADVSSED